MEKYYNKIRLKKIILTLLTMVLIFWGSVIWFSPYGTHAGFSYKLIKHTIKINTPVEKVYKFLGNSANAPKWSVFVDHITTLNSDAFPDGFVGSKRRCFCNSNEKGTQWDELITENIPNKKRQLVLSDFKDFSMTANNLATEQLYEDFGNSCHLTFTVFFKDSEPTIWENFKIYLAAYRIKIIFEKNMENIKKIVEQND